MRGGARTPPTPTGGRKLEIKIMEEIKWHTRGGGAYRQEAGGTQQAVIFFTAGGL
jgi:hypothetical protein